MVLWFGIQTRARMVPGGSEDNETMMMCISLCDPGRSIIWCEQTNYCKHIHLLIDKQ